MKSLNDLVIEFYTLELRFEPAFLLWDRTGFIWTSVLDVMPGLKLSTVQPNQQVFETDDLQLTLELSQLRVISRGENALEELIKSASALTARATEMLKIHTFKRAGFRTVHTREFSSIEGALRYVDYIGPDESQTLGKQAVRKGYAHSERFETETAGIQAILRIEERELNFSIPWEIRRKLADLPLARKSWNVIVDNDYYTIGLVDREGFDVATWVSQAWNAIQAQWRRG